MNFKKYTAIFVLGIYVCATHLGIHAFAMHTTHSMQDVPTQIEDTYSHTSHSNTHKQENHTKNSMECVTQSKHVLSTAYATIAFQSKHISDQPTYTDFLIDNTHIIDTYCYYINDPGRGEEGMFSKFLDDLYGRGIVMID